MSIVLGKSAHAQQSVHHAGTLIAIHRPQFTQPHRQIAIRLQRILVNQNVERAIHRLQAVFGIVEFHDVEHVFRVVAFVARGLPQLPPHHMRRVHQRISALDVLVAHPVFHLFADDSALGMPENQSWPGQLLNGKQVELLPEHAMVALFGFFLLCR